MRRWARSGSKLAFVVGLGIAQLVACSSDSGNGVMEVQRRTGTLGLALQTMGPSGNLYRLRDAAFQVVDRRSGDVVDFLFSEDQPASAAELRKVLLTGNYDVELLDGWFIERIRGGSIGTGGSGPSGSGGTGAIGSGGSAGKLGAGGTGGKFGGKGGSPGKGGGAGRGGGGGNAGEFDEEVSGEGGASGEFGAAGAGGSFSTGGSFGSGATGGTFGEGGFGAVGAEPGSPEMVPAQLVSDAIQSFALFGFDEAFVRYTFHVGEEELDFDHGRLNIGIEIIEGADQCETPENVIDPGRVLLETNVQAVGGIALREVFEALVSNGQASGDGFRLYQEIIDSYATPDRGVLAGAAHCGDESTDGSPTLNGYRIDCNRSEHSHIDDPEGFFATAFVNRLDLAPQNGAHCGQQRVIFSSNSFNRMFMIVETQIPNPTPELGIQGCLPLAQFWLDQDSIDDPIERGQRLRRAFLTGAPELAGFGPFLTATNLTIGSGQIRTNQFDSSPWTLREFKLALDGSHVTAIPFPVAESPPGLLWDEESGAPQGEACRESFLSALDGLLTNDFNRMSFIVDDICKDAESRNDFSENYVSQMSSGFRARLEERLLGTSLTPEDAANRAQFAGSCIGCHAEANGVFLGDGLIAPRSNDFVHVTEFPTACESEPGNCFIPSPALREFFLPSRLQVLGQLLGIPIVDDPCNGGTGGSGAGGSSGSSVGGSFGVGGFAAGGVPGSGGVGTAGGIGVAGFFGEAGSGPAPEIDIALPSADDSIVELQAEEEAIRDQYGEFTLSGKSAKSTH